VEWGLGRAWIQLSRHSLEFTIKFTKFLGDVIQRVEMLSPVKGLFSKVIKSSKKELIKYDDKDIKKTYDTNNSNNMIEDSQFYDSENGHETTNGIGSSDSNDSNDEDHRTIEVPSQLIKYKKKNIKNLCNDLEIDQNGKKYEIIGRLLKKMEVFPKSDLFNFSEKQLREMCSGINISYDGNKESLVNNLYESLSDSGDNPGKRPRNDDFITIIRNRNFDLPMTPEEFMNKAKDLTLDIENKSYKIIPKEYSTTRTYGWYQNGRQTIELDGVPLNVAWNINITVIGR